MTACDAKPIWEICADEIRWYQNYFICTQGSITYWRKLVHFLGKYIYSILYVSPQLSREMIHIVEMWHYNYNSKLLLCFHSSKVMLSLIQLLNFPHSTCYNLWIVTQSGKSVLKKGLGDFHYDILCDSEIYNIQIHLTLTLSLALKWGKGAPHCYYCVKQSCWGLAIYI